MRELRFDGLSPDGTKLILAGKDGQRWSVTIDERIEAAVRRDRARLSRVEIDREGVLRPREIQARIRAGATAEDVAAASGLPVEHVRRFEGPVLTERAWVAQQAQGTEVRRPGGDIELGDLVAERLLDQGVDPADVSWDAWRRDDGQWVVIATFPVGPNTLVATWTYDSSARTMTVADDNARALSAPPGEVPLRLNTHTRPALASVPRLQSAAAATAPEISDRLPTPEPDPADAEDLLADADDESATDDAAATEGARETGADAASDGADEPEVGVSQFDGTQAVAMGSANAAAVADPMAQDAAETVVIEVEDAEAVVIEVEDAEAVVIEVEDAEAADLEAEQAEAVNLEAEAGEAADSEDGDRGVEDEGPVGTEAGAVDVPLFDTAPAAPPAPRATGGRPPVPSFDDILFGPGPRK